MWWWVFFRTLTPRIVRQKVEEACQLEAGTLDTKEWKTIVKEAQNAALVRLLASRVCSGY